MTLLRRSVPICAALLLALAPSALGYFSITGAGTATANVGTVNPATNLSVTQSGANVVVSWSAGSVSTGVALDGYKVTRSDGATVCGSPTLVSALTCTDSAPTPAAYTYTVTAVYRSMDATVSGSITVGAIPTLTSTPPATSASSSPSISFTGASGGATYQCQLDSSSFSACTSPEALKALNGNAALADGAHTFSVRLLSGATAGPASSYAWTINTSAPTITVKPAAPSATTAPSFSFSHAAGSYTFKCKLDAGSFATCTSPTAYTGLATGSHTFTVEAFDSVGVQVPTTTSYTWSINSTAPTISAKPTATSANTAPSFSFTHGVYTSFECQLDSGGFSACSSPKALSGLSDGSHTFGVEAVDGAGFVTAVTSYAWTVNSAAPTFTSTPASLISTSTASFGFSDSAYSSFKCQLDGGSFSTCTSPKSLTGLSDALHTFKVEAIDADGVATAPAGYTWTVDTTPPTVTAISATDGDGKLENGDTLAITFSKPLNASTVPTTIAAGAASESRANGASNVMLTIPGITNGAEDTGSTGYLSIAVGSVSATFGGTVSLVNGTSSATVTVTVSGLAGSTPAASSGRLTFAPATTIQDQLGGAATGSFKTPTSFKLF